MFKSARLLNQKGSPRFGEAGVAPIAIVIAVLLVVLGGGGYYYQSVYKPALIKETTVKIQSDYKTLSSSVDDLLDKMTSEKSSNSDPDSLKKSLDEMSSLRSKAETTAGALTQSLSKKQSEVNGYTSSVENYLKNTKELLSFSKSIIDLNNKLEDANVELRTISGDVKGTESNPAAMNQRIKEGLPKIDKIIKDVEEFSTEKDSKEVKDSYVSLLKVIRGYYSGISKAIDISDSSAIYAAQSKYQIDGATVAKDVVDANQATQDRLKEFKDILKKEDRGIESEYNSLNSKYK